MCIVIGCAFRIIKLGSIRIIIYHLYLFFCLFYFTLFFSVDIFPIKHTTQRFKGTFIKMTYTHSSIILFKWIGLKGMTFNHEFCYSFSFSSSLFFEEGREKGKTIIKVVVKSHAFLLDPWKATLVLDVIAITKQNIIQTFKGLHC